MGETYRARYLMLAFAALAALSTTRCNDTPVAPTGSFTNGTGSRTDDGSSGACFETHPSPPEIAEGESVAFDASCTTGTVADEDFHWDLGDGRSRTGRRIEARYSKPGDYRVRLSVGGGGGPSEATIQVRVRRGPEACFVHRQILEGDPEPCTVAFDATCSAGAVVEYRWFFEGGPRPDLPLPDTNITTTEPTITYSWGRDEECFSFRPFDRVVRLTVVDEGGATDSHQETVVFTTPILKH